MSEYQETQSLHTKQESVLLEARQISHEFDYPLFQDINLELHKKQSIAIIGMSGSGKSTLLNIMSSLLKPNSGEIIFNDQDIYTLKKSDLLKVRREDFGIIFQAHYLFRGFTADENLQIASFLSNEKVDEELLKAFNIEHVINQGVGELSGGQQQRLSIARILTKRPKIIFADEPTGNLDKETALDVMKHLNNYIVDNEAAMILVTHEHDLAMQCDKVYKLSDLKLEEIK